MGPADSFHDPRQVGHAGLDVSEEAERAMTGEVFAATEPLEIMRV
jgi:hypothetical protein